MLQRPLRSITSITTRLHQSPSSTTRLFSRPSSSSSSSAAPSTPSDSDSTPAPASAPESETAPLDPDSSSSSSSASQGKGYRAWLAGDGAKYRRGIPGRTNWLGDQPFPLNPTFSPLPPLADILKTRIYNSYTYNLTSQPSATDASVVRAISAKFGVSMMRVRAVIRLKELEKRWKDEGIPLQTSLLTGMESHLGVKQPADANKWRGIEGPTDGEVSQRGGRAQRKVTEMVDVEGGDSPVLPLLALRSSSSSSSSTSAPRSTSASGPKRHSAAAKETLIPASRPGRAATLFRDVSGTEEGRQWAKEYEGRKVRRGKKAVKKEEWKGEGIE